jgi:hypothetical protein
MSVTRHDEQVTTQTATSREGCPLNAGQLQRRGLAARLPMECAECGMLVSGGEFHPVEACRLFERSGDSVAVRRMMEAIQRADEVKADIEHEAARRRLREKRAWPPKTQATAKQSHLKTDVAVEGGAE